MINRVADGTLRDSPPNSMLRTRLLLLAWVALPAVAASAGAETGRDLWLRYTQVASEVQRVAYRRGAASIAVASQSATGRLIAAELQRGLRGLLGGECPSSAAVRGGGAILAGTPATSPEIAALGWNAALERVGEGGYVIRSARLRQHDVTVIASRTEVGALYGAFHFLRLVQTGQPLAALDIAERPRLELRLLDHWDNLDGTIERG
jgi:alpha-glucuronidase